MFPLLLFFLIPYLVHCTCPQGYELVSEGQCRGYYGSIPGSAFPLALASRPVIQKCQEVQAQPVIIHNDEEQAYWENIVISKPLGYLIIGLVCNTTSTKWEWADGSPLDYKPNGYDSILDSPCSPDCSWYMWKTTAHSHWDGYCVTEWRSPYPFYVYCTTQFQPVSPVEGCENFADDTDDNVCYQIGSRAESWEDAQLICKNLGANLASIHNTNENSFVRRLAVSRGAVHGVFLGATVSGKGGNFEWIDGSEWDYTKFYPGFPKSELGDCIAMDTSATSGQWMNVDCSSQIPVACIREKKSPIATNATCSYDSVKEGEIMTSPGFPFDASVPCDYYLEADAGKKVKVEIAFLEANSCCDSLILYEGYFGGFVIANLTGEISNVTYTTTNSNMMRVSWMPNGGVNVKGMAMIFRGV